MYLTAQRVYVCVCVSMFFLCVLLLLFFSDCRIYLFSFLAAIVFNKLTHYSLIACHTVYLFIGRVHACTIHSSLPAEQAGHRNVCAPVDPGSRLVADSVVSPHRATFSSPRQTRVSDPPSSSPAAARTPLSASDCR